jgi:hypothetical protein
MDGAGRHRHLLREGVLMKVVVIGASGTIGKAVAGGFVVGAAIELPRRLRRNVVSPP